MKCKVVSLLIDAPIIVEPAGKDIGILWACLEFDRKKTLHTNKTLGGEGWEEAGLRAGVCYLMTNAKYAFLWFSFMFLHKAFFMLSCYFVAACFSHILRLPN